MGGAIQERRIQQFKVRSDIQKGIEESEERVKF